MRIMRLGPLFAVSLLFGTAIQAQQSPAPLAPTRDPTAITLLQKSVAAMATSAPSDSSATGNISIVEGSTNESGSISIQTLGTGDTAETIDLPDGQRAVIYSYGDAKEVNGTQSVNPPVELIVVDQCADFPLPFLSAILGNPDESFRYIGPETLNGAPVQHIQVWNSFASKPRMQKLASFSTRDIWLDAESELPMKISYQRQPGEGAVHVTRVEVFFSNYTKVNGVEYPFQISKSYNGLPWQTITIQSVAFNTGLTDTQFQTETVSNGMGRRQCAATSYRLF
ncbi:MAG TPA: hypothetical protein VNE63_20140 [Candidatus Acidoferrales bacterium]|nr:hypothetical protein [Candidatus Acidoferrales bacterium]